MLITSESVKHQIDIVNPYVKLLGSTDIMSESGKKTPIVPPDQGATGMTATVVPKGLESEWLQFLKLKEEDKEHHEMEAYYNTLVENMQKHNPVRLDPGPTPNIQNYSLVAALKKSETQTANICQAPPSPPSEKDNLAEIEESLRNQRSWFLKQNEELLKLLDSLHRHKHWEVVQEEEILDRISDFTLVLFEYVKTLKRKGWASRWLLK